MDIVAVLLAAGESERMGSPKALLPWQGHPLLIHQIQQIQKSRVQDCVVVLGREADRLRPLVRPTLSPNWKAREVVNPRHRQGKCSSILVGLSALWARPDGVLIAAVDQPLHHRLIDRLIEAAEEEWDRGEASARRRIVLPCYRGRRGHPVLFCSSILGELLSISEESEGLRAVVRRDPERILEVPWDKSDVLLNINRPTDRPAPDLRRQLWHH